MKTSLILAFVFWGTSLLAQEVQNQEQPQVDAEEATRLEFTCQTYLRDDSLLVVSGNFDVVSLVVGSVSVVNTIERGYQTFTKLKLPSNIITSEVKEGRFNGISGYKLEGKTKGSGRKFSVIFSSELMNNEGVVILDGVSYGVECGKDYI